MRAFSGSIVPGHAARQLRVVAGALLAVTALPYTVVGQCTPLTCDTPVTASIDGDEVDCFTFTASHFEVVHISVVSLDAGSVFKPAWRLLDSSGGPVIGGGCGEFGPSNPNFPCVLDPAGSPFRLEVVTNEPGDTGAYAVRFAPVTAYQTCEDIPLTCGVPVYGTLEDPLDTDLFSFSVEDGEWVEISAVSGLHGGTVIDAAWRLIDGRGLPVEGPCGQFGRNGFDYACGPLPASRNPYRILVGDDGANDAGQYKVRFQRLSFDAACSNTALTCGVGLIAEIDDPPPNQMCGFAPCPILDTELFNFSVNDGERIAVTVEDTFESDPRFRPGWRLLDRTGYPVDGACGDFNASSRPNFECGPLAAEGNPYQIEVGDVGELPAGRARVSVNFLTSTCEDECPGDCNGSQVVGIHELIMLVKIILGDATLPACVAGDTNRDGIITANEFIIAVNRALDGCGGSPLDETRVQ
jgi:hypothetical protein